ncbi:MAG: sulfocyanin-like copper-binding protein [Heteroscytonema crispum UTEX LB 1556]
MKIQVKFFFFTAIFALLSACNNNTPQATPTTSPTVGSTGGTKIQATTKEMEIQLSQSTVPAGNVEFVVTNQGKVEHEFVVIKTDLPLDKLPLKGDRLDEDKAGKEIGEIDEDELKSGTTKTLSLNLTPGKYLIVCNLPGHFKAGMRTLLTVK